MGSLKLTTMSSAVPMCFCYFVCVTRRVFFFFFFFRSRKHNAQKLVVKIGRCIDVCLESRELEIFILVFLRLCFVFFFFFLFFF